MTRRPPDALARDDLAFSPDGEEWVEFGPAGHRTRVGFHDYAAIYAVPGLYEAMFYETLGMRSTFEVVSLYAEAARTAGIAPRRQRIIDLGAGNGIGGEQLRALGVGALLGVDLEPMARAGALRDRPGLYDDYLVADLLAATDTQRELLDAFSPTAVVALSAVGIGHLPPAALEHALGLLPARGLFAFAVTPTLLPDSTDEAGRASGFPSYLRDLWERCDLLAETAYVHRARPDGSDDPAVAFVGQIRAPGSETTSTRVPSGPRTGLTSRPSQSDARGSPTRRRPVTSPGPTDQAGEPFISRPSQGSAT